MEWETIDRDQVLEIMAGKQPTPPKESINIEAEKIIEEPVEADNTQTETQPENPDKA